MDMGYATDSVSNSLTEVRQGKKSFLIVSYYLSTVSLIYKPKVYLESVQVLGQDNEVE